MTEFRKLSYLSAYRYVNNIFGNDHYIQQDYTELSWFLDNVKQYMDKVNVILEIGSLYGHNLCMLSLLLDETGIIISIEPELEHSNSLNDTLVREIIYPIELEVFRYKSDEAYPLVKNFLGDRLIDVLFIDGCHSYSSVKSDFETYSQFVVLQGIIGIHDIMKTDTVGKAWKEIKSAYPNNLECLFAIGTGIVIK